ncbi:zinc finger protein 239-like [Euwallacea fornicatus]|uniref:zinc finger protein 239-like n=1 Tax=Euwallacea fornicatus TaxID=995702 RepID=UPI00338E5B3A
MQRIHLNDLQYCCEQCGKSFVNPGCLNRHIKGVHAQQKSEELFPCDIDGCSKIFKNKGTLNYHKHKHMNISLKCELCPKTFTHPYRLAVHLRKHHSGKDKTMFQCNICQLQLTTKSSLNAHIRTHTGERPFVCGQCDRGFTTSQQLKSHSVVHTKEKPFGCTMCCKRFTQRGTLSAHLRTGHRPEVGRF